MKRYDAYKSTGIPWIPEVPEHWEVRRLGLFFSENKTANSNMQCTEAYKFNYGTLVRKDEGVDLSELAETYSKYTVLKPKDIVINGLNLNYDFITLRVAQAASMGIITSAYVVLSPRGQVYDPYFCYLFRAMDSIKLFHGMGSGIRLTLSYKDLKYQPLPLPPLSEQRAIVAYIERKERQIDAYIARQAEQIERLKELRQTIISHAVTRGIHPYTRFRPTGIPWIPEVPEHWEMRKSTRIFPRIGSGTTPKTGVQGYYTEDNGIYWLQTGDLNDGLIEDTAKKITRRALDESNLNIYPIGSVVIAMYGATIGKVGLLNIEAATNQACCVLPPSPHYISKYAISVFMSVKTELIRQALGGGQPNISQETIRRIRLPLPPLSEQRAIVAYIEKKTAVIDRKINACREQTELMKAYKQRLISDAVTGRINVLPHD
jgi:hypothetical protein